MQKLELQYAKLYRLLSFLGDLSHNLQKNLDVHRKQVNNLSRAGLSQEVVRNYVPRYSQPKIREILRMIDEIQNRDIPYVKKNLLAIEQAIQEAKS